MTPQQRRSLLLALPVAVFVGLGLFGGGSYLAAFQFNLLIGGRDAAGTVTALEFGSSTSASGQAALFPIVTYERLMVAPSLSGTELAPIRRPTRKENVLL